MSNPPPPPPRREYTPSPKPAEAEPSTWSAKMKAKGSIWGKVAVDKGTIWSDKIGGRVNDIAEKKFGTEHFWPVTGDLPKEMDKCARILRAFTVEGIVKEEKAEKTDVTDDKGEKKKKTVKVLRKIPPKVIQEAKGIVIFTAMRSGIAPFGGAGGSGVVLARLPDGSWSAPASISPNNLSTGLLAGIDVYDCILVLRDPRAVEGFFTHKFTLGAEIGIAAGPYGSGGSVESGMEKAAVFSYIRSKGLYAGIEITGTVFVERFDENGNMYHWNGVKAGDILGGKVRVPPEAASLHQALLDAETGKAQHQQGDNLDTLLDENNRPLSTAEAAKLDLDEGEVLKLPPTPEMTDGTEYQSDPETMKVHQATYASNPASGTDTPSKRRIPPPLPARSSGGPSTTGGLGALSAGGLRPPIDRNDSSTSHYSDEARQAAPPAAVSPSGYADVPPPTIAPAAQVYTDLAPPSHDFTAGRQPADGPPGYDQPSAHTGYPVEKGGMTEEPVPYSEHAPVQGSSAQEPEGMTEGERREWEQYHADQQLAQQANQLDFNHEPEKINKEESLR